MKKIPSKLRAIARVLIAKANAYLTVLLLTEPVRVRSWVAAGIVAVGTILPALTVGGPAAGVIAGVLVSALTVALGEDARNKVTPVVDATGK